ncbi:unnamed protein product [Trifolium pratense]|uniref:Uncharacterized protein n=1 Tax=Trifolium pratense TaxID=57577 RepID=A0ACB0L6V2_TRIPR|nr:unnamed protein product [Trifolium pratense]
MPNQDNVDDNLKEKDENFGSNASDVNDNCDDDFLPTEFGKKIKEGAMRREKERLEEKKKAQKQNAGLGQGVSLDFGAFENHTKRIGSKLLAKMGYKFGGGLGTNQQGILNPIDAMKPDILNRSNESKKTTTPLPTLQTEKKNAPVGDVQPTVGSSWLKQWKKKKKEEYVTAEDLLASKQEEDSEVVQKIYDMRGPEIDSDLRKERDIALSLKKEKENLEVEASFQKNQLDNYEKILNVLDQVGEENTIGTLTLDSLAQCSRDMHKRYPEDYKLCNLSCIACSYALPLFIRVFQGWDPLRNPSHGLELVSQWKELLQVLATILDTIVMPKLSSAVGTWEPHQETIPIHTWVHPWLPMLGHKLEGIYQTIRFKLSTVLDAWHPSDGSAYAILSPWKTVFDSDSWQQLMHRFIVPKLKAVFVSDDFQVNPASQKLDQFYWVMSWASVIPVHLMVDTMDIFFTKWLTVLYRWLCSNPNFNEVLKWFLGWKELIPKELLANELIRYKLNCGLVMMNQAAEGMEVVQPGLNEKISYYIRVSEQRKYETHQKAAAYISADGANEMSVKEIIEAYARDHGLLFKLKPGRMHNGHQIYGFGNVSIIIDSLNQKVYAQDEERWSSETLGRLLELHNRSLSKRR